MKTAVQAPVRGACIPANATVSLLLIAQRTPRLLVEGPSAARNEGRFDEGSIFSCVGKIVSTYGRFPCWVPHAHNLIRRVLDQSLECEVGRFRLAHKFTYGHAHNPRQRFHVERVCFIVITRALNAYQCGRGERHSTRNPLLSDGTSHAGRCDCNRYSFVVQILRGGQQRKASRNNVCGRCDDESPRLRFRAEYCVL